LEAQRNFSGLDSVLMESQSMRQVFAPVSATKKKVDEGKEQKAEGEEDAEY
jgi:hypothetical protein